MPSVLHTLITEPSGTRRNATSGQWCEACGNEGWITLLGETRTGHHTTSAGAVPCRYCEVGGKRYIWAVTQTEHHDAYEPIREYTWDDVLPAGYEKAEHLGVVRGKKLADYVESMKAALRAMKTRSRFLKEPVE